jgi:hypothetical protein
MEPAILTCAQLFLVVGRVRENKGLTPHQREEVIERLVEISPVVCHWTEVRQLGTEY